MITWVRDISHQRLKSAVIFQIRREGSRGRGARAGEREQRLGGGRAHSVGGGGRGHLGKLLAWNNIDIKCPQMLDWCRWRPRLPILLRDNSQLWISWESDFCFLVQNWSGPAISLSLLSSCSLGCDLLTLRKYYSELSLTFGSRKFSDKSQTFTFLLILIWFSNIFCHSFTQIITELNISMNWIFCLPYLFFMLLSRKSAAK